MKPREGLVCLIFGLVMGTGLALALNSPSAYNARRSAQAYGAGSAVNTPEPAGRIPTFETSMPGEALARSLSISTPQATSLPDILADATPTLMPLEVGAAKGPDLEDVVLLYDSTQASSFDTNFCKVAEYYGLLCKKVPVNATLLTDELLQDEHGDPLKLIGVSAETLLGNPSSVTREGLAIIQAAIEAKGVHLLVSGAKEGLNFRALAGLTQGAVLGVARPPDSRRDWIVSAAAPEITQEFTGQVISSTSTSPQGDPGLVLAQPSSVTTLISGKDDAGEAYPVFVRWKKGAGSVFIDSGQPASSLEEVPFRDLYYHPYSFSSILPLMFTMRYAMGDEAWHNDHDYANLTIDDPALTEPWHGLTYVGLLQEMKAHNFHTTIAFVPANWNQSQPAVADLFRANPDRYSLVQHGNNHDRYEFYKYSVSEDDMYDGQRFPPRPLADQEADIVEGFSRMVQHTAFTGIPWDPVMIFPYGISPEQTLVSLKTHNYLATVNAQDVPLDTTRPSDWDYGMYQANMAYGDFPALTRRSPGTYLPFRPWLQPFIFDLFIGKPALFYSHAYEGEELFASGINAFNPVADQINALPGEMEWQSLGYIIRHLYLEKTNDDGSIDIRMYGNDLIISNESGEARTYHLSKQESLNVPISSLTVNGDDFLYRVERGILMLDISVPAGSSAEILILYRGQSQS